MRERLSYPAIRDDGLQLEENRSFQERYWLLQRFAWAGFAVVMVLALLGLTGSGGYFQKQTIRFDDAVVQLPLVSRWEAADEMRITFEAPADIHTVTVAAGFFDRFDLERIEPEPAASHLHDGGQVMTFHAEGDGPHVVRFSLRAMHFGWTNFDLTIGGMTRPVNLVVLP